MVCCFPLRCCFWLFAAGSVFSWALARVEAEESAPADPSVYWIFLTTGESSAGRERSEIEQMQAAHLANFGRLYKEGKLLTVGPMADPRKKLRGIVLVKAADRNALAALFEPDPYVEHGILTIDAIPIEIAVGDFQKDADTMELTEYRLVLLEKSQSEAPEIDAESERKNLDYCASVRDGERLCFAGWLRDDKLPRRAILIFHKLDEAQLKSLVDDVPAVKSGLWKATSFPLYMGAGMVK